MSDDLYAGDESSGLLTHYIGRVKDGLWSTFFAETKGQASSDFAHDTLLFWHTEVLDILQANYEAAGTPIETSMVSFGIGKKWHQDPANPNLVEHEDDSEGFLKKFHMNTAFMRFIYIIKGDATTYEDAVTLDGDGPLGTVDLGGVRATHAQHKVTTLRDATIWNNMIFEYRGLGFPNRQNPKPNARAYPVRYLGYDASEIPDVPKTGIDSTTNSPEATGTVLGTLTPEHTAAWTAAGVEAGTVDVLTKLWANSNNVEAFMRNAGLVVKDDAVLAAIAASVEAQ